MNHEGFDGFGFDLRSRKSWSMFSPLGARLHVATFSPRTLLSTSSPPVLAPDLVIPEASFLIGNHADELTPWIPVMTALVPGSKSANVPCCFHQLANDRFSPTSFPAPSQDEVRAAFGIDEGKDAPEAEELVRRGGLENVIGKTALGGRYQAYARYIASLTLSCGSVAPLPRRSPRGI